MGELYSGVNFKKGSGNSSKASFEFNAKKYFSILIFLPLNRLYGWRYSWLN
jgi:hypothetical protein